MLPKINRFTSRKEFAKVKKNGRLLSGRFWGALVLPGVVITPAKFGFIVSKKVDKRAVVRNRLRRQLSEALKFFLSELKPGIGVIFLVKKNLVGQKFMEIKEEMGRCLKTLS